MVKSSLEVEGGAVPNDRLRDVLLGKGLTPEDMAERLGVDPKTVERWITVGRTRTRDTGTRSR